MRLWVICGKVGNYEVWEQAITAGKNLLKKYDLELSLYRRDDITYVIDGDGKTRLFAKGAETEAPDKVLLWGHYDGMMEGISNQLTSMGTVSINSIEAKRIAGSKLATAQLLASENIPQAKTMPIYHNTSKELILKEFGLPLIVKPDLGFGGKGIELLHTEDEVERYLADLPEKPQDVVLAQEYIGTSKGRDLRVVMVGGKAFTSVVRQAGNPEEFRSNIHQGGHYEEFTLTDEVRALCEKTAKLSGLAICGLDLLFKEDGFVIGEINCSPGIQTLVQKAGIEKFITLLIS